MKARFILIATLAIVAACAPKSKLPKADNKADAVVAAIHDPSCKYVVVASHRAEVYDVILDLGTSMIQTDRPEFLIKYLESKGRR